MHHPHHQLRLNTPRTHFCKLIENRATFYPGTVSYTLSYKSTFINDSRMSVYPLIQVHYIIMYGFNLPDFRFGHFHMFQFSTIASALLYLEFSRDFLCPHALQGYAGFLCYNYCMTLLFYLNNKGIWELPGMSSPSPLRKYCAYSSHKVSIQGPLGPIL